MKDEGETFKQREAAEQMIIYQCTVNMFYLSRSNCSIIVACLQTMIDRDQTRTTRDKAAHSHVIGGVLINRIYTAN